MSPGPLTRASSGRRRQPFVGATELQAGVLSTSKCSGPVPALCSCGTSSVFARRLRGAQATQSRSRSGPRSAAAPGQPPRPSLGPCGSQLQNNGGQSVGCQLNNDHLPLYRQSQIFARQGIELGRSRLCNWVGRACWWLAPLHELMLSTVLSSPEVFADDTTLPLDPGNGRTKTGRLWCYAVDNRPWQGPCHPIAAYAYSEDRKAEHPASHLKGFRGLLQVDGYAGFGSLVKAATDGGLQLAFCWARLPKVPCAKHMEWQTRGTRGASSTTSTSQRSRRLPSRPCGGSPTCMRSKATFTVGPPTSAAPSAKSAAARWWRRYMLG
jgi:Transposase IS66 family